MPRYRQARRAKEQSCVLWQEGGERERHIRREKQRSREMKKSTYWRTKVQKEAQCFYCAVTLTPDEATLDHIVPLSQGGKTTKGNVAVCCHTCNARKHSRTPVEWLVFDAEEDPAAANK